MSVCLLPGAARAGAPAGGRRGVTVVTPPPPLVSVAEAKAWMPVFADDSDERVGALLAAAQGAIERSWIGRTFGAQVLDLILDAWPDLGPIELPFPPVTAVLSITFRNAEGTEQTLAPAAYRLIGTRTAAPAVWCALPEGWPELAIEPEAVRVRYAAGYAADDPDLMPARQAVALGAAALRTLGTRDLTMSSDATDGIGETRWIVSEAASAAIANATARLLRRYERW